MIIGIIPARFASTRLMGKPLANIGGKPMIRHTYDSALGSKLLNKIIIAVDDGKVAQVVRGFGADVVETPKDINSGSDRVAFVVKSKEKELKDNDIVVNIQGDEPFIKGEMIDQAIEPLVFDQTIEVATLVKRITTIKELKSPDVVKVVFDYSNFALYFSRSPVPFVRNAVSVEQALTNTEFYKHLGLYVFRKKTLLNFTKLKQTDLEKTEMLEQLRMLENGIKIKVVETEFESMSVDTQEDLKRARAYYKWYQKSSD